MNKRYIIDHYYAIDHIDFCRIIESDRDIEDIKEIFTAINFYYEENMNGLNNGTEPTLDSIIKVLCKDYGVVAVNKDTIKEEVEYVMEQARFNDYQSDIYCCKPIVMDSTITYLDWYEVRESLCGKDMPSKLYKKWLTAEIIRDIEILLVEDEPIN